MRRFRTALQQCRLFPQVQFERRAYVFAPTTSTVASAASKGPQNRGGGPHSIAASSSFFLSSGRPYCTTKHDEGNGDRSGFTETAVRLHDDDIDDGNDEGEFSGWKKKSELCDFSKNIMQLLGDVAHCQGSTCCELLSSDAASLPMVVAAGTDEQAPHQQQTEVPGCCGADGAANSADTLSLHAHLSLFSPPKESSEAKAFAIEELKGIGTLAPCGKGTETITDTNERSTLTCDLSKVRFVWDGLGDCIRMVEAELKPLYRLAPQLHSVLVYREGDHFRWHADAKKSERHIVTLSVDCTPPSKGSAAASDGPTEPHTVEFRDGHAWKSQGCGSWAAWFASEQHRVPPAQKGAECVVAIFNLIATHELNDHGEDPTLDDTLPDIVTTTTANSGGSGGKQKKNKGIFGSDVQRAMCLLERRIAAEEPRIANLRHSFFTYHKEHNGLTRAPKMYVGVVLTHKYSFDDKEHVPDYNIRGRDKTLIQALKLLLAKRHRQQQPSRTGKDNSNDHHQDDADDTDVHVRKCMSVIAATGEDCEYEAYAHVASNVEGQSSRQEDYDGMLFQSEYHCKYADRKEKKSDAFEPAWRDSFSFELDDDRPIKAQELVARGQFPVYFLNDEDCALWANHAGEELDSTEELWGNAGHHVCFVYRSACVVGVL